MSGSAGVEGAGFRKAGRRLGFGVVLAIGVGLLMVVAPVATASSPTKLKAPYGGTEVGTVDSYYYGCGGTVTVPTAPHLNLTNGVAFLSANATQKSCGKAAGNVYAYVDAGTFGFPISLKSGKLSIREDWKVTFSVDLTASPGSASQYASSSFDVYAWAYVYDETNGSYHDLTFHAEVFDSVSSGSYSHVYTGLLLPLYINSTFVSSHSYELSTYLEVDLAATTSAGSSSASAVLNMATSGHKGVLEEIVIS